MICHTLQSLFFAVLSFYFHGTLALPTDKQTNPVGLPISEHGDYALGSTPSGLSPRSFGDFKRPTNGTRICVKYSEGP